MRIWWENLAVRERRIVLLAGLLLAVVGGFVLAIEPMLERRAALNDQLQTLVNEHAWLEAQAPAVRAGAQAGPATAGGAARTRGSVLGVVDVSARAAGLGAALRRVRPQESGVEVELEAAPYAAVMAWLATVEGEHGLRLTSLNVDRGTEPGRINAQLRIEPPAPNS